MNTMQKAASIRSTRPQQLGNNHLSCWQQSSAPTKLHRTIICASCFFEQLTAQTHRLKPLHARSAKEGPARSEHPLREGSKKMPSPVTNHSSSSSRKRILSDARRINVESTPSPESGLKRIPADAKVRQLARFQVVMQLLRIEQQGAFASLMRGSPLPQGTTANLNRSLRKERQVTELLSNVTRWRRRLDYTISKLARMSALDLDPGLRQVLRVAIYELTRSENALPPHVLNEHVEIAKAVVHEGAASFANGVLRAATQHMKMGTLPLPLVDTSQGATRDLGRQLAIYHSHPTWMVIRWMKRFGLLGTVQLMEHYNQGRPTYGVRVNTALGKQSSWPAAAANEAAGGATASETWGGEDDAAVVGRGGLGAADSMEKVVAELAALGVEAALSDLLPSAFLRVTAGLQTLLAKGFVSSGRCSVQDESSGLVVALLDPQPGERVLDACAAPGGKTIYAAMRMRGQGSITATDVSAVRVTALQHSVNTAGFGGIVTAVAANFVEFAQSEAAGGRQYDRVLVDVPCSGTGVLGKRADMRWRRTAEDLVELTALQDSLLDAAASVVSPGGVLVYSTCSIEAEEDEQRVAAFLERHPRWAIERPMLSHEHGGLGSCVAVSMSESGTLAQTDPAAAASGTTHSAADAKSGGVTGALPVLPARVVTAEGFLLTLPHVHGTDGVFAARLRRPCA